MIDKMLVAASLATIEDILKANNFPYELEDNEAHKEYTDIWEAADEKEKELILRKARPAIRRIAAREPYIFERGGKPLQIMFNDQHRELKKDSFGELFIARPDMDWGFAISVKNDPRVIAMMPVADRDLAIYMDKVVNVFNEIDDFGDRIFGVPCSNEYFDEMNDILMKIEPTEDRKTWAHLLTDEEFACDKLITPMLRAIGREVPRICADHPEAPRRLIEYFYGRLDYYFIAPIDEVEVTRIGAVNAHGRLGRMPGNENLNTPRVEFPTKLLDVRFANGRYGELSRDTMQFTFDGGWSICLTILVNRTEDKGLNFALNVYLPVTPFGSYRDQVKWDK